MKYTLLSILLMITVSGIAQSKKNQWIDMQTFGKGYTDTAWVKGDTVVFSVNTTVKFIQIGDDIYQIVKHNPTIEKAPQTLQFGGTTVMPGTLYNYNLNDPHIQLAPYRELNLNPQ